ncbi:MAG: insulinase family protein, partial [Anaerolineales bacterium]|nr:insulinase family protein [Anaerolineales bacterium]
DMVDLEVISRDDLYAHYRRYYNPNNAIAVAVGDFSRETMLARIAKLFAPLKSGPDPRPVHRAEPEQRGERQVTVEGDGETAYLVLAYHAPNATDTDFFPLSVLAAALVGAGGPGGGGTNKSSRLYKALVETELAAAVGGGIGPMIDPSLFTVSATLRAGGDLAELETALDAELERLLTSDPVTEEEWGKAIKRAKAAFAFGSESVTSQGSWLGFSEITAGSYVWFQDYLSNLQKVTTDDVARVAANCLDRRRRTIGRYVPSTSKPKDRGTEEGTL